MIMLNCAMAPSFNSCSDISDNIKISSFNMHGFNQGIMELKSLCSVNKFDVIFTQEHWLSSDLLSNFDYFKADYNVYSISSMDQSINKGVLRGRPFGGLCTMIRKSLCKAFSSVTCISSTDRYIVVALDNLLLVNVYMPCCRNALDHELIHNILYQIGSVMNEIDHSYVIIGGDINCNVFDQSVLSKLINDDIHNLGLSVCNQFLDKPCNIEYTFAAESRQAYSIIDHFFVSNIASNFVRSLDVIHDVDNHSDHLPLVLELDCFVLNSVVNCDAMNKSNVKPPVENDAHNEALNWSQADLAGYCELTRIELMELHNILALNSFDDLLLIRPDLCTQQSINNIYRNIVHVLIQSGNAAVPHKNSMRSCKKYWWDETLRDTKRESMKHHQAWLAAGRPKSGDLFLSRNSARKKYKNAIHKEKNCQK